VLTILFLIAQQVSAGVTPAPNWPFAIAAPVVRSDGRSAGSTSAPLTEGSTYYVSTTGGLCTAMTIGAVEPKTAGYGWRLTVPLLQRASSGATVKIEWQRLWERGRALADGPRGETQLVLRREERVPLDQIAATPAAGSCDATGIGLELLSDWRASSGGGVGGGGAVAAGPRGGGRAGGGGGSGPAGPPVARSGAAGVTAPTNEFDLELWLVDRNRDGAESVQPLTVHSIDGSPRFFFRPGRIDTPAGRVVLEVSGQIRSFAPGNGSTRLLVSLQRRIEGEAAGGMITSGGSSQMIPMPQPDEVISFDLPAIAGPRGSGTGQVDPLNGHTFSVRMRITAK
jgi:hypothetical protein